MWRACGWMALLVGAAFGDEPSPLPSASIRTSQASAKTFEVEGPEEALRVSFDDLELRQLLNIEEIPVDVESHLPEWLKKLNGKTVRINGAMFPPPMESGLKIFLFTHHTELMHFGRRHHVDEKMGVRMREGVTADYISGRPFDVVGKFTIKSRVSDGKLHLLYTIEDAVVIDE